MYVPCSCFMHYIWECTGMRSVGRIYRNCPFRLITMTFLGLMHCEINVPWLPFLSFSVSLFLAILLFVQINQQLQCAALGLAIRNWPTANTHEMIYNSLNALNLVSLPLPLPLFLSLLTLLATEITQHMQNGNEANTENIQHRSRCRSRRSPQRLIHK